MASDPSSGAVGALEVEVGLHLGVPAAGALVNLACATVSRSTLDSSAVTRRCNALTMAFGADEAALGETIQRLFSFYPVG